MPVVPISTHRALSHIANPRVEADDKIMFIAFEDNEMIGYLGVLPDCIYNDKGESFKCGWLSCMWVNPDLRGKGIAKSLLQAVFTAWDKRILVTEFTPAAKGLYDASGQFDDLRMNAGLNCYLRFNLHEVLPKKNEKYQTFEPLLKAVDALANIPNGLRLAVTKHKHNFKAQFEPVHYVDNATGVFIQGKQKNSFERRGAAELNWIMKMPWIKQSAPTTESKRYHFSSVANRFENVCFKLRADGKMVGLVLFSLRNNHLKIPYAYFDDEYTADVVEYTYQFMRNYGANMLTIYHSKLVAYIAQHGSPFIYKRSITRHYIISKILSQSFTQKAKLEIQDGDADCAFT